MAPVFSCCNLKSLAAPSLVSESRFILVAHKSPWEVKALWCVCNPLSSSPECGPCRVCLWLLIVFILIGDCCLDAKSIFFFAGDILASGYVSVQGFCSFMNSSLLKQSTITPLPHLRCLLSSKVWEIFNLGFGGYKSGIYLTFFFSPVRVYSACFAKHHSVSCYSGLIPVQILYFALSARLPRNVILIWAQCQPASLVQMASHAPVTPRSSVSLIIPLPRWPMSVRNSMSCA